MLVLVAWKQAEIVQRQITILRHFVKAGRGSNNTDRQLVSYV
jgi:hypothetical protein